MRLINFTGEVFKRAEIFLSWKHHERALEKFLEKLSKGSKKNQYKIYSHKSLRRKWDFFIEEKLFLTRGVDGCLGGVKKATLLLSSNKHFHHKVLDEKGERTIATAFSVIAQFTKQKIFHLGKHFCWWII